MRRLRRALRDLPTERGAGASSRLFLSSTQCMMSDHRTLCLMRCRKLHSQYVFSVLLSRTRVQKAALTRANSRSKIAWSQKATVVRSGDCADRSGQGRKTFGEQSTTRRRARKERKEQQSHDLTVRCMTTCAQKQALCTTGTYASTRDTVRSTATLTDSDPQTQQ